MWWRMWRSTHLEPIPFELNNNQQLYKLCLKCEEIHFQRQVHHLTYSTIKWMCFGWLGLTAFNCEKDWWLGRSAITIVWGVQWVDFMGSNLKYLVLVNRATRSTEYSFSACKPTNLCCQFYQYQRAMTPESPIYNQPFDHNHQLIITLTFWPIAEQHCCHNSSKQQHKSKFGISSTMLHNATMNDEPCNQCIFTND